MGKEREIVEAVVRACHLLRAFYHQDVVLTLGQLVERSGLSDSRCVRR